MHKTQGDINSEFAAVAAGSKPLAPQLIAEQTHLANQIKDLFMVHRELGDAPADARDPLTRVPPAVMKLLTPASSTIPFSRDDQEAVKLLLEGIARRLESSRPERILNYLPMKTNAPIDPAITAQSVGRGRVVFISTSANQEWTDFPSDLSYPQLMFELLDGSLRSRDSWMNLIVGDRLAIPAVVRGVSPPKLRRNDLANTEIPVFPPERDVVKETANSAESQDDEWRTLYHTDAITQPGRYTLEVGSRKLPIAVNVPASAEADVTTVDNDAISQALGGVKVEDRITVHNPDRDYFGWLTLILVLMLAGFECFIAWRFGHAHPPQTVAGGSPLAGGAGG
jgi:hypothetical protein